MLEKNQKNRYGCIEDEYESQRKSYIIDRLHIIYTLRHCENDFRTFLRRLGRYAIHRMLRLSTSLFAR